MENQIRVKNIIRSDSYATVRRARFNHVDCVLKTFHDQRAFQAERAAYLEMVRVSDLLEGRVPRLLSHVAWSVHPRLFIQRAPGSPLSQVLPLLSADQRATVDSNLQETLRRLHQAGISHGDVVRTNVVFDGQDQVMLVNFGAARLRKRVSQRVWEMLQENDLTELRHMFAETTSEQARREVLALLEQPAERDDEAHQEQLLCSLKRVSYSNNALLSAIQEHVGTPTPRLAIELARHLGRCHRHDEALRLLADCLNRCEMPPDMHELHKSAARHAAQLERASNQPVGPGPLSACSLFDAALNGASSIFASLSLCLELVHHLSRTARPHAAARYCVVALIRIIGEGRLDAPHVPLLNNIAQRLERLLPLVRADEQLWCEGNALLRRWEGTRFRRQSRS